MIANKLKRIGAIIIDSIALGVVGWILALFFEPYFVSIGSYGRFVGFFVSLTYFSVFNSHLFKGQTIGKRFISISVHSTSSEYLTLKQSTLRATILTLPILFNGFPLGSLFENSVLLIIAISISVILVFGIGGAELFLFLFNNPSNQTLHDLISGSIVLENSTDLSEEIRINKKSIYSYLSFFVVVFSVWLYSLLNTEFGQSTTNKFEMIHTLNSFQNVDHSSLQYGNSVNFILFIQEPIEDFKKRLPEILDDIDTKFPGRPNPNNCTFTLNYGFSIGIASKNKSEVIICKNIYTSSK